MVHGPIERGVKEEKQDTIKYMKLGKASDVSDVAVK